jgi:hypothetical protein
VSGIYNSLGWLVQTANSPVFDSPGRRAVARRYCPVMALNNRVFLLRAFEN